MSANISQLIPKNVLQAVKGSSKALRELKKVDPRDRFVLVIPNSSRVASGIGFNLLNNRPAEEVFETASELLKRDLWQLCLNSSKSELSESFESKSIASYVTNHATIAKIGSEREEVLPLCKAAGGVGIGFINCLVFAEAMSFEDGLDLVQRGAQAMERAAKVTPNAKLRIFLRAATRKRKVCQAAIEHCLKLGIPPELSVCSVTAQIKSGVIEVGGHEEAIKYLEQEGFDLFEFKDMKRIKSTPQAYHTNLMMPAHIFLKAYLKHKLSENSNYLKEPSTCSVYSATAGRRLRTLDKIVMDLHNYPIKPLLVEQLLHSLFSRSPEVAQPNTLVLWDKVLLENIKFINRKAYASSKLFRA